MTAAAELSGFATWLDGLVKDAHRELSHLQLANWSAAGDAQINTFLNGWNAFVTSAVPAGSVVPPVGAYLRAFAGTAIEAYVCKVLMPVSAPPLAYVLQRSHGSTIVDVVATASDGQEGWFDITCAVGHILNKTSWLTRAGTTFVEEITYPALNFNAMYARHHAGARRARGRPELVEAAAFIRAYDAKKESDAKKRIKGYWLKAKRRVAVFAHDLAVTDAEARKILYYASIDTYQAGKHPRSAKHDGKMLWGALRR